jgi:large subunit ribosomal protein L35
MPKLKTHKGASKRFKKTGTGLVVRNHAFGRHILTSKPHKRKKKLHQSVVADKADQPVLKRMIPYSTRGFGSMRDLRGRCAWHVPDSANDDQPK